MNSRILITLIVVAGGLLIFSASSLILVVPVVPLGFALASTQPRLTERLLLTSVFALIAISLGESATHIVLLAFIATGAGMVANRFSFYARALTVGAVLLAFEYIIGFPGFTLSSFIVMVIRAFLVSILSVGFINMYALQKY